MRERFIQNCVYPVCSLGERGDCRPLLNKTDRQLSAPSSAKVQLPVCVSVCVPGSTSSLRVDSVSPPLSVFVLVGLTSPKTCIRPHWMVGAEKGSRQVNISQFPLKAATSRAKKWKRMKVRFILGFTDESWQPNTSKNIITSRLSLNSDHTDTQVRADYQSVPQVCLEGREANICFIYPENICVYSSWMENVPIFICAC